MDELLVENSLRFPSDIFYKLALPLNLECLLSPVNSAYDYRTSSQGGICISEICIRSSPKCLGCRYGINDRIVMRCAYLSIQDIRIVVECSFH